MPNKNYKSGRALEYRIKSNLEALGYFVIRAAGSHGVADLVAIKLVYPAGLPRVASHRILFVSCKTTEYAPPEEKVKLLQTARKYGAFAMMTVRMDGRWELQELV